MSNAVNKYISDFIDIDSKNTIFVSTSNIFNITSVLKYSAQIRNLINLSKMNNFRYTNKFLENVNSLLKNGDYYVGCVETLDLRKKRHNLKYNILTRKIRYFFDVIFHRIFPKLFFFRKIYFLVTKGRRKVFSKAECLGRLVSCGFKIVDYKIIDSLLYFVVIKNEKPVFDNNASYGPLFKMKRLGKNGKIFHCYKFRTMHPFSEYLHNYILKNNGYSNTGKPADDFRVTSWGKFLRKYWLDEIPQLINVFRGEMKLVGVRPISKRYAEDIPSNFLKIRLKFKPGCIPPYVSLDKNSSKESVLKSEKIYLEQKLKHPYFTDIRFFVFAIFNIFFKGKRSA